jgi:uncharacterized protein YaaR (DUF327 family)
MKVESGKRRAGGGVQSRRTREAGAKKPRPVEAPAQADDRQSPPDRMPPHIRLLLERLSEKGVQLVNEPSREALEAYKEAVREFLRVTMEEATKVRAETPGIFSRTIFATITRVDVGLAELADEVMSAQCSIIRVAKILDDIKGLLIDLYR